MPQSTLFIFPLCRASLLLSLFFCVSCTPPNFRSSPVAENDVGKSQSNPFIATACRHEVWQPALFRTTSRNFRISHRTPEYQNIPAEIRWQTERIQIEPARFETETVPAVYREVVEDIVLMRERIELVAEPGKTADLVRQIQLKPAHTRWKPGCLAQQDVINSCLETVPEKSHTLLEKIPDIPVRIKQKLIPGKTMQVKRKVLVKPGKGKGKVLPARYMTIRKAYIHKPWEMKVVRYHPERYETLEIQHLLRASRVISQPAVCENQLNSRQVTAIQTQLKTLGYLQQISGKMDKTTLAAIIQLQLDKQLGTGALTQETLRTLELI